MKSEIIHYKLLFKKLIIIAILFQLCRLLFYVFNINSFDDLSFSEILMIFLYGTRFDLSAIIICYFPLIILYLLPGNIKNIKQYQKVLKWIFVVFTAIILVIILIDIEYFKFTNKRSTADLFDLFGFGNDIINLIPQFLRDFWYIVLFWIFFILSIWYFYPEIKKLPERKKYKPINYLKEILVVILLSGILLIAARGFDYKPVRIITAARYTSPNNFPLILNTPFTIIKTLNSQKITPKQYFDEKEALSIFNPTIKIRNDENFKELNVVLIILESFSNEYIGALNRYDGYTPFLDSLINNSLVFSKFFANGKKSIEALPAIISSLPALMDDPYISSPFASNSINSLATELKSMGYSTSFFHGGANGTMGFDNFVYSAGIEEYFGKNEYPFNGDYDGNWGIFDEEYLQYYANKLSTFKEPFFSTVFTLSSHHPYTIPKKHIGKFPSGRLEIHQSISYADYSLKRFFETASKKSWFNNTLFVITADHTSQAYHKYYNNNIGKYSVPLIFYNPTDHELKGKNNNIVQQTDIMPSILDYLNYNGDIIGFGQSVFDTLSQSYSINYLNGIYQFMESQYCLNFDGERSIELYDINKDSLLRTNILDSEIDVKVNMEKKLKSIIQNYYNRLINNQLNTGQQK